MMVIEAKLQKDFTIPIAVDVIEQEISENQKIFQPNGAGIKNHLVASPEKKTINKLGFSFKTFASLKASCMNQLKMYKINNMLEKNVQNMCCCQAES